MRHKTPKTSSIEKALAIQLKEIRRLGVAFCREEMALGVNAIGVPIFDHANRAVAAVVIAGLASRVKLDMQSPLVIALRKAAREISAQLFHQGSMQEEG